MENKKTAIEWLEDNLNFEPHDEEEFISNNKIWEQAKEMGKEQIEEAHFMGLRRNSFDPYQDSIIYFQKTYGKI